MTLGFQYAAFWTPDASNTSLRYASISRRALAETGLNGHSSKWESFTLGDYAEVEDDGHDM